MPNQTLWNFFTRTLNSNQWIMHTIVFLIIFIFAIAALVIIEKRELLVIRGVVIAITFISGFVALVTLTTGLYGSHYQEEHLTQVTRVTHERVLRHKKHGKIYTIKTKSGTYHVPRSHTKFKTVTSDYKWVLQRHVMKKGYLKPRDTNLPKNKLLVRQSSVQAMFD